jgi:predicted amidophosphoribosyltransferase
MFGLFKRPCAFCAAPTPRRKAWRAPDRKGVVCQACFERWERAGRRCPQCQTKVAGPQEIGAFFDRRALGHADCGGVRLFAT